MKIKMKENEIRRPFFTLLEICSKKVKNVMNIVNMK